MGNVRLYIHMHVWAKLWPAPTVLTNHGSIESMIGSGLSVVLARSTYDPHTSCKTYMYLLTYDDMICKTSSFMRETVRSCISV
jgi:hypothetical protein